MGQCYSKVSAKEKEWEYKAREVKGILPHSPLGEMLRNWEEKSKTKGLEQVKMVRYCVEI